MLPGCVPGPREVAHALHLGVFPAKAHRALGPVKAHVFHGFELVVVRDMLYTPRQHPSPSTQATVPFPYRYLTEPQVTHWTKLKSIDCF